MNGYLDKLRMSSIYRTPNFGPRPINNPYGLYNKFKADQPQQGNLQQIGRQVAAPVAPVDEPMNTVYQPYPPGELTPVHRRQFDLQEQAINSRNTLGQANIGIRQQDADTRLMRADIQAYAAANPDLKIITQRGGNIIAIDPKSGEIKKDFGSSGLLSDAENIQRGSEADIARIEAGGDQDRLTQTERALQKIQELMEGGRQARETQAADPFQPSQQRIEDKSRIERILNQNPSWRKFVSIDGDNIKINDPMVSGQGIRNYFGNKPDAATHAAIQQAFYGQEPVAPNPVVTPPPASSGGSEIISMLSAPDKNGIRKPIFIPKHLYPEAVKRGATMAEGATQR